MSGKRTILLIDDEVDLRDMLKFQISKKGYDCVTAADGLEGLERLKTVHPDLIVLDINMPRMGGIEFYNQILDAENRPKYPVFILTARANLETLFKDLEVKGFMSKPFEVNHLIEELERILSPKAGEGPKPTNYFTKQVLIADSDPLRLKEIAWAFLKEGFRVNTVADGTHAIEHINGNVPDYAVINWHLRDIAGDVLVLKMQKIVRARGVNFIMYTDKPPENMAIMEELRKGSAIDQLVESDRPEALVNAVKDSINARK